MKHDHNEREVLYFHVCTGEGSKICTGATGEDVWKHDFCKNIIYGWPHICDNPTPEHHSKKMVHNPSEAKSLIMIKSLFNISISVTIYVDRQNEDYNS